MHLNKIPISLCVCISIALFLGVVSCVRHQHKENSEAIGMGHAIGYTKLDLITLGTAFMFWGVADNIAFSDLTNQLGQATTLERYYGKLTNYLDCSDLNKYILRTGAGEITFRDRWNNPIMMKVMSKVTHPAILDDIAVKLWSIGPNRRDENGLGDDIVYVQEWKSAAGGVRP